MAGEWVLVTGGSGFIAAHCIVRLLTAGYRVRATLRSPGREAGVRAMIEGAIAQGAIAQGAPAQGASAAGAVRGGSAPGTALSFAAANLESDDGWPEAVAGCSYVLHVASPFPASVPKHADELVVPARDGALRVLTAARDAGVRRVVLTSSFAAVGYGHAQREAPFTEADWTDVGSGRISAYVQSKVAAERAAWDFVGRGGGAPELAVVNPVVVFGPVLGPDLSTSVLVLQLLMQGKIPLCPRLSFGVVDVRDVADLHLRAMCIPEAKGQRFLAVAGRSMSLLEIAQLLRSRFGAAAARAPTREMPDWMARVLSPFSPSLREILPELGKVKHASNEKARRVLGWTPLGNEEAVVAAAESLIRIGADRSAHPPTRAMNSAG